MRLSQERNHWSCIIGHSRIVIGIRVVGQSCKREFSAYHDKRKKRLIKRPYSVPFAVADGQDSTTNTAAWVVAIRYREWY